MATINTPNPYNPSRPFQVQGVVLLDPVTGLPAAIGSSTVDSAGTPFTSDACSHVYGYNGSGQMITDTATDGTRTWVKTFSYTSGNLTGETKWVLQ
ncbi:hypothetical protein [Candidatus Aalborgicola defluviihabitans]|uniref:hypothetical protein n=1 Tax=Candidatus Aalborgicola defluviihabitans TaxID=3386187 RepID=UPI001E060741|nr:hypothetical protein [Burkholderiales bacterium]